MKMDKNGTMTDMAKAAMNALTKLGDNCGGASFYDIFREGAEWMIEKAVEWAKTEIKNYVSYDGEVDDDFVSDFEKALDKLVNEKTK